MNSSGHQPSSGGLFGNTSMSSANAPGPTSNTQSSSLFGAKPPANIFGTTGMTTEGPSGNTSATGATGGGLFGNAANTSNPAAGGGLFGGGMGNAGLFGQRPATTTSAPAAGSLFGGGSTPISINTPAAGPLFGGGPANTSTSATGGTLFGDKSAPSLFNQAKPTESNVNNAPKPSLFGANPSAPSTISSSTTPAPGPGLFGLPPKLSEGAASAASSSTTQSTTGASTGTMTGLFGGGLFNKPSATSTTSTATSTASPFSLGGNKDTSSANTTAGGAPAPAGGLFGGTTKPEEKKDGTGSTTSAPAFSLFGAKTEPKKDAPTATTALVTTTKEGEKPIMATSVAVPPPSMLRGKTLEEIVNRWSSELETHVREFHRFAAEVAVWDRALIENGNNLTALYSHIFAAERQQNDIDQSLDHIEQQQKDLASTLDAYEKISQELLGGQGGNLRTLDTGPADTERDKNYMLATDLHTQLDDLSGSLSQMIDAVNALSVSNKSNGESNEDPMAQISHILSSHLESLQWIDTAVREVETKVSEVEKRVKESGYGVNGNSSQGKSRGFGLNR